MSRKPRAGKPGGLIAFRATSAERTRWESAAKHAGADLSAWLRQSAEAGCAAAQLDQPVTSPIQRRLRHERAALATSLLRGLKSLRHRVDDALAALADGRRIDPILITNSAMLTAEIDQWNLVRDLIRMMEPPAAREQKERP